MIGHGGLPGIKDEWGEVESVAPMASGANNDILLVRFPRRELILKRTRKAGINRLREEAAILRALGGHHAPLLIDSPAEGESETGFLWMQRAPGGHLHSLDADAAGQLGRALGGIHGLETGALRKELDSPTWEGYFQQRLLPQLENSRGNCPEGLHAELERMLGGIMDYGRESANRLSGRPRCLVHTDVIPLNAVFGNGECVLIDWELGRLDYPEWDLASVGKSFRFFAGAEEVFRAAYGRPIDHDTLRFCSLLHYANVALWRACSYYVRGENRDIAAKFLAELDLEMAWIRDHLPGGPRPIC